MKTALIATFAFLIGACLFGLLLLPYVAAAGFTVFSCVFVSIMAVLIGAMCAAGSLEFV
jgi:hypothetical protein